jgi:hypothetical protein
MSLRPFVLILAAILLPISVLFAQAPKRLQSEKVAYDTRGAMKLLRANPDGSPSVMIGVNDENAELVAPGSRNSEREVSLASRVWMASISESVLGLSTDAELRETSINRTNDLWLSSYELFYHGIPVRARVAHLNIGAINGKLIMLRNNLPSAQPITFVPQISKDVVMSLSRDIVGSEATVIEDAQLIYVHNRYPERLDLAYETTIRNAKGDELWRLTFDATSGELLERKDLIAKDCFRNDPLTSSDDHTHYEIPKVFRQEPQISASGKVSALVHPRTPYDVPVIVNLPNLAVTLNSKTFYTDASGNYTATNINNPLIISTFGLAGKYLTVSRQDGIGASILDTFPITPANMFFNDENSHIAERDAYYSLEEIRRHIRTLDTALVRLDLPLQAVVNYPSDCNAFYDQSLPGFTFFDQSNICTNTASVADVVYHEFGHRVNHARYGQAAGNNRSMNDGSLNEGFADVISALRRDDPRIGIGFYKSSATKTLRNIENTNKWPKNINSDTHFNGLIIAGAFWDLRKTMGLAETEKLFHMMGYQRPDGPGGISADELEEAFTNTLLAAIITDDNDNDLTNGTPNMQKIIDAFEKHNITLTGLIDLTIEQIPDQDAQAAEYPVQVTASYASTIGSLDTDGIRVNYRHIDSSGYTSVILTPAGNNNYTGVIPKMPAGSIIEYYASATTSLSETSIKQVPLEATPMRFLVGYKTKLTDDCESAANWNTSIANDNAARGLWAHGDPDGTFYQSAASGFIQQDTDHTVIGTMCFVTGNAGTNSPSYDDIDSGTTTLVSPLYNVSTMRDPYLRFWYFYSNNTGQNPGQTKFLVKLTTNEGVDFQTILSTSVSTDGWAPFGVRLKDDISITDKFRIYFIASDNIGALVEAAVDDIEILDAPALESVDPDKITSPLTLFPNPVTGSKVTVHLNGLELRSLILRDLLGKIALSKEYQHTHPDALELAIPETLANGAYMLEYTTEDGTVKREKLIIAR